MNVTPLSRSPAWMSGALIDPKRFDTGYYDPSLTVAESLMREGKHVPWKRLGKVGRVYNFGAYELTNKIRFVERFTPGAVPFVTITNINNLTVDFDSAPWIDQASHRLLSASICRPGIVMVSIAGTIGRAGVVPSTLPECNGNQAIAKIEVNDDESDPHFLAAYLTTRVGAAASEREAAGAVQKNLYIYNVEEIPVPCPEKPVRTSIGHKVRGAERLRAAARFNVSHAVTQIDSLLGTTDFSALKPNFDGSCNYYAGFIPLSDLSLFHGAQFYAPKRKQAVALIRRTGIAHRLGAHGHRVRSKGKQKANGGHVDPANVSGSDGYWYTGGSADGGDVVLAKPGQALFLRMRPYLNKTTINDTDQVVSGSPEFLVYEFEGLDAYYATLCLRQPWALAQVAEIATGDRPRVDGEFVDEVMVPWPDESVRHEIGQLYKSSFALRRHADQLVQQAIADVENLIDGKLDEDRCLAEGRKLAEEFGLEVP